MKRKIFTLALFAQVLLSYAYVVNNEIKIPENYKIKGSFSGELTGEDSFHTIVAQNKDQREFEIFLYKLTNDKIEFLGKSSYERQPSILSFHNRTGILTLVISYEEDRKDFYNVLDVNLQEGSLQKSTAFVHENAIATFRENNETILVNGTKKYLKVTRIKNGNSIRNTEIKNYSKDVYNQYFKGTIDEINQNEFVKNGSVNGVKGYYQDDRLIFTKDFVGQYEGKDSHITAFLLVDLVTGDSKNYLKGGTFTGKMIELQSYILDNLLVQFTANKKEGAVFLYDLDARKNLRTHTMNDIDNNVVLKGKDFTSIEVFLKEASKGKYLSTITLNKTRESNYLLRLDYVENTYSYNYNWWWWHQHMFMMHQQQMLMQNNMPRGFGPNNIFDTLHYRSFEDKTDHSIQFVIDQSGNIVNEPITNTVYKSIEKKKYVDELNDDKALKHASSCFVEGKFRYIAYNKKSKSFTVYNKSI